MVWHWEMLYKVEYVSIFCKQMQGCSCLHWLETRLSETVFAEPEYPQSCWEAEIIVASRMQVQCSHSAHPTKLSPALAFGDWVSISNPQSGVAAYAWRTWSQCYAVGVYAWEKVATSDFRLVLERNQPHQLSPHSFLIERHFITESF